MDAGPSENMQNDTLRQRLGRLQCSRLELSAISPPSRVVDCVNVCQTHTPQPFCGPLSGTTRVSQCQNFWTLWCKGRLTEADTPTIRLGATPSWLTSARHLKT